MPALGFTDQRQRLRAVVENALFGGAGFESSRVEDDGRLLVIELTRQRDRRRIVLRFRGVKDAPAIDLPQGTALRSGGVHSQGLLAGLLHGGRGGFDHVRVRIEGGATAIDVLCQDAEWWEA